MAVVEVKIWGRPGFEDVQGQVESCWTAEVEATAVVMLTDAPPDDWPAQYRDRCLGEYEAEVHEEPGSPVRARIAVPTRTSGGLDVVLDHFLLPLLRP